MNVLSLKFVQKMEIQSDTDVERKMDGLSQKKQLGGETNKHEMAPYRSSSVIQVSGGPQILNWFEKTEFLPAWSSLLTHLWQGLRQS